MKTLSLGYSSLTGNIYVGHKNKDGSFQESKQDITNDFINMVILKFGPQASSILEVDGIPAYKVIVCPVETEIMVGEKKL